MGKWQDAKKILQQFATVGTELIDVSVILLHCHVFILARSISTLTAKLTFRSSALLSTATRMWRKCNGIECDYFSQAHAYEQLSCDLFCLSFTYALSSIPSPLPPSVSCVCVYLAMVQLMLLRQWLRRLNLFQATKAECMHAEQCWHRARVWKRPRFN